MRCLAIAKLSIIETLRRKEFYVLLALLIGLAGWMQMVDLSASGTGRFTKDIIMQLTWLASFALAVPLAARQIVTDVEQKTVYILVARPIARWEYVLGRALGAAGASIVCFSSMFAVLLVTLTLKGGAGLADASLWQAFALQVAALLMISTVAVFFSTVGTSAGAVTFAFLIFGAMRYGGPSILNSIERLHGIQGYLAWTVYLVMPHFEFFSISQRVVHGWGPLPQGVFLGAMAYGVIYSVFAVGLASVTFRRRWL